MTIYKVLLIVFVVTLFCIGCFGDEVKESNNGEVKNPVTNINNKTVLRSSNLNHQDTTKRHLDNAVNISELEGGTAERNKELGVDINELDKDIQREDNYCFPKFRNVKTVSKNFDSDEIKRIVVYFYIVRDKAGNVKEFMYIPDENKQHQLPDLPSQNNDLIIQAKHLTVKEILNDDNPFIINNKEYSSVPDKRETKVIKRSKIENFRDTLPTDCYDTDKGTICKNERGDVIERESGRTPNEKDDNLQVDAPKESTDFDEETFSNKPGYHKHQVFDETIQHYMSKQIKEKISKPNKHSSTKLFNMLSDNDNSEVIEEDDSNETGLDNFEYESDETFEANKQLHQKHLKIYDKWVNRQIFANDKHFKKDPNLNIKLMKADIIKGLSEKGFIVNKKGHIKDENGNSYNMANVKLIPILKSVSKYNKKQIKYIVVVSQKPFRILTIIPINNKLNKHDKINKNVSPFDSSDSEELGIDSQDSELPNKQRTNCITGCLKRRCRMKRSNPYPYDIMKQAKPCSACKLRMGTPENKEKKDLTDILVRILGGSAAMGSGRPIRNKGRNNIVSEDSSEK